MSLEQSRYTISAHLTRDQFLGYLAGNVIERCGHWSAPDGLQKLREARKYLNDLLAELERKPNN